MKIESMKQKCSLAGWDYEGNNSLFGYLVNMGLCEMKKKKTSSGGCEGLKRVSLSKGAPFGLKLEND